MEHCILSSQHLDFDHWQEAFFLSGRLLTRKHDNGSPLQCMKLITTRFASSSAGTAAQIITYPLELFAEYNKLVDIYLLFLA